MPRCSFLFFFESLQKGQSKPGMKQIKFSLTLAVAIAATHRLSARIISVSNIFHDIDLHLHSSIYSHRMQKDDEECL